MSNRDQLAVTARCLINLMIAGEANIGAYHNITRYLLVMVLCVRKACYSRKALERIGVCMSEWKQEYHAHDFSKGPIKLSDKRIDEFNFIVDYFESKKYDISEVIHDACVLQVDKLVTEPGYVPESTMSRNAYNTMLAIAGGVGSITV